MERNAQKEASRYPVGSTDWLIDSADMLRRSLPVDDQTRLMLSGSYAVKILSTDVVLLPTRVPHLVAAFEGEALGFTGSEGKRVLIPGGIINAASYIADNLQTINIIQAVTAKLKVGSGGEVIVPGVSSLEGDDGVSIACVGSHLELLNSGVLNATLERDREEVDKLLDGFSGLPTGSAA